MYGRFFDMPFKPNELPSINLLNEFFEIDAENGILYWKQRKTYWFKPNSETSKRKVTEEHRCKIWNTKHAGNKAGRINFQGYRIVYIFKKIYQEHRIIYKMFYGHDPEYVDHINGIRYDNRPSNLRSVSNSENQKNKKISSNNTSGYVGISWCKLTCTWLAHIGTSNRRERQRFVMIEDAIDWRNQKAIEYNFHENHGRERNAQ